VLPLSRDIMKELADKNDWLEVTVSDNVADLTPERLSRTDVVMFFTTGMLPLGDMLPRLYQWIKDGGAFVGVHSATDTLAGDPEYVRMVGGTFDGHPWNESVTIVPDTDGPPDQKRLAEISSSGKPFTLADEIYQFKSINPDKHVLLHLDPATPKAEKGREYPLTWTRTEGKGRIFYTALGHRPEVWKDDRFLNLLLAGIKWAAAREPK
jgi:type 1 glutamine amidotransferase